MKRMLIILFLAALTVQAFAQFVPGSLLNSLTMDLFKNEIDLEFQANPDFGLFGNDFLFAGLGNPGSGTYLNEAMAFDTSLTAPLKFGYYMAGTLPISLYSSMYFTGLINRNILENSTDNTYNTENVTAGTTTTGYDWLSQSDETVFTNIIRARTSQVDIQALTKLGPVVLGLYLALSENNIAADTGVANGYFQDYTSNIYDNTAGVGVIPVTALDYTVTGSINNINPGALPVPPAVGVLPGAANRGVYAFGDTLNIGIPFAMRTGTLEHRGYVEFALDTTDNSGAYSLTESAHVYNAGAAANNDRVLSVTSKSSVMDIIAQYDLTIPAGGVAGNEWQAQVYFDVNVNSNEYAYDNMIRPYDLSVVNVKTALAGGSHVVRTDTYSQGVDLFALLGGARVLAFEPAAGILFRFAPSIMLGMGLFADPALTGSTAYTAPLDAAGAVDATIAYNTTTVAVTGNPAKSVGFVFTAGLPMGLTIKPADWKFGLLLGAVPALNVDASTATSSAEVTTTTTVNTTGATINATTIDTATNTPNNNTTIAYGFGETHYMGITVPFDGGVRFDIRINGSLLNFENFVVQAFVPFN